MSSASIRLRAEERVGARWIFSVLYLGVPHLTADLAPSGVQQLWIVDTFWWGSVFPVAVPRDDPAVRLRAQGAGSPRLAVVPTLALVFGVTAGAVFVQRQRRLEHALLDAV